MSLVYVIKTRLRSSLIDFLVNFSEIFSTADFFAQNDVLKTEKMKRRKVCQTDILFDQTDCAD